MNEQNPSRPKNWLVESILVMVFCCAPFGIAGLINAINVNSLYDKGYFEGAEHASKQARKWTKVGLIVGPTLVVLYFIFVVFLGVGTAFLPSF